MYTHSLELKRNNGARDRMVLAETTENGETNNSQVTVCTNSFNDQFNGLMDSTLKGFLVQAC